MAILGIGKKEVIYFSGCYSSAYLPDKVENYRLILKKLKVKFDISKDIQCCGGVLEEAGYEKELRKLAKDNFDELQRIECKKIITSCPLCSFMFSDKYKEFLPNWQGAVEIENILSTILRRLREYPDLVRSYNPEQIIYYDSCYALRYNALKNEAREILRLLGYKILEIFENIGDSLCCGSCGLLPITNPDLSEKIGMDFIRRAMRKKIKKIVTADPRAYKHLRDIVEKEKIEDLEIIELSEILCSALDIRRIK